MKNLFKDFFYLYFAVQYDNETKVFLNYKKANLYYHRVGVVNKRFLGNHLTRGWECFHLVSSFEPTPDLGGELSKCQKYYCDAEL